jgi:hypothetical protein
MSLSISGSLTGQEKVQTFLPPHLLQACNFLISNETRDGGWPALPGTEISLYHTALVAHVLSGAQLSTYETHIARANYCARERFGRNIGSLEMLDLSYLLQVSCAEGTPDREWVDQLAKNLISKVQNAMRQSQKIKIRDFSVALLALDQTGETASQIVQDGLKLLQEFEIPGTGSWRYAAGGNSSIIVSAFVLRAFKQLDPQGLAAVIRRSTNYLQSAIAERGWDRIGTRDGDVFAQAIVLRALANSGTPRVIEEGVTHIEALMNPTGGWGASPGEPSGIETTALAIDALVSCGENKFVSYRSTEAKVAEFAERCAGLQKQLSELNSGL